MADTTIQTKVAEWVRQDWLPKQFGQTFRKEKARLSTGGLFNCEAVSQDHSIFAAISTSGTTTASGKAAAAKLFKIRSDMYFLLLTNATRRVVVLTEKDMYTLCQKEQLDGRVPLSIEFFHADHMPEELQQQLTQARNVASREVSPRRRDGV